MQNYFNSKKINNSLTLFLSATVFSLLAGCGDGGTSKTTTCGTACASTVQLLVSSQQMLSSSIATTTLTAVVLDANGQALTGKAVTFAKGTDSTAYFSQLSGVTDANGIATATLNMGSNMTNRVISITATADSAAGTNSVSVAGTKISVSGSTSLALNAYSDLTIIVKDSSGAAVSGVALAVTSKNGNTLSLSSTSGVTDASGQIQVRVTGTTAGTDVLTITGAGATQTQSLTVNSGNFSFIAPVTVAPATTPEILVSTNATVSIKWVDPAITVPGQTVYFNTSRGTVSASAFADATGVATVTNLTAGSTGAAILTAAGPNGTPAATLNVVFITNTASSVSVQASPSTVAINASGSTTNQAVISVVVRDPANNLVKNAHVVFTQVADASGGSLATGTAITDITGTASVNYIAGPISSGQNGVKISATVDSVNNVPIVPASQPSATALLTVASQSLFVRLGTDNKVYPDVPVPGSITKQYTALVTDAAGNPAPDGTEVRFVFRPADLTPVAYWSFAKGFFSWGGLKWAPTYNITCVSEDTNLNGTNDLGEDTNQNGRLDPSGVASVNAKATTVSGFAIAKIAYAKEYAYWVQGVLEARAGTIGNDPPSTVTLLLPGAASDYTDQTISPPGITSPFGLGNPGSGNNVCTNTL